MYVVSRVGSQPRTRRGDSVPPGTRRGRDIGCPKRCQPRQARGRWHAQRCTAPMFASSRDRDLSFSPPMHTRSMSGPSVGDVQVTSPAVQYSSTRCRAYGVLDIPHSPHEPSRPCVLPNSIRDHVAPCSDKAAKFENDGACGHNRGGRDPVRCSELPSGRDVHIPAAVPGRSVRGPMEHDPSAKAMGLVWHLVELWPCVEQLAARASRSRSPCFLRRRSRWWPSCRSRTTSAMTAPSWIGSPRR